MRGNRGRLAWTVLLASFGVFMALLIAVPAGTYLWIQRATLPPLMVLQAIEGTPLVRPLGDEVSRPVLDKHEQVEIKPGTTVTNQDNTQALLTISSPDGKETLGSVQIYPNTELQIAEARSPRYSASNGSHLINVTMTFGRVRLGLAQETGRRLDFSGRTPHTEFRLWQAGSYSMDVSGQQSEITVREGKATIDTPNGQLELEERQRGLVSVDQVPVGPLPPQRDLIADGRFHQPLGEVWQVRTDAADSSQPAGEAEIVQSGGREAVRMARSGLGHAETGIFQLLNHDLTDYQSLHLHVSARLDHQSLGVCGSVGSECPLMVRVTYEDSAGSTHQWVQGFYYWVDPAVPNPTLCETCPPPRQEHERHGQGIRFFYDSANLIEILAQNGNPPVRIGEIAVYASGHSYDVQVSEIELLVEE